MHTRGLFKFPEAALWTSELTGGRFPTVCAMVYAMWHKEVYLRSKFTQSLYHCCCFCHCCYAHFVVILTSSSSPSPFSYDNHHQHPYHFLHIHIIFTILIRYISHQLRAWNVLKPQSESQITNMTLNTWWGHVQLRIYTFSYYSFAEKNSSPF